MDAMFDAPLLLSPRAPFSPGSNQPESQPCRKVAWPETLPSAVYQEPGMGGTSAVM